MEPTPITSILIGSDIEQNCKATSARTCYAIARLCRQISSFRTQTMPNVISGVLPVFQTPFDQQEEIDYPALKQEIDWLLGNGADGIVMGMVSETLRLSCSERMEMAERCRQFVGDRGKLIISVGAESSHTAAAFSSRESAGADALMAIPRSRRQQRNRNFWITSVV